jgi:hypothetical protein
MGIRLNHSHDLNQAAQPQRTNMQLTTDMPYSPKTISNLGMNVSREADKAFMQELKRTDRKRYDQLDRAIRIAAIRIGADPVQIVRERFEQRRAAKAASQRSRRLQNHLV